MKIGILTGGGDVPGLNACLKALTSRALDDGHTVIGIRRGWAGILQYNPDEEADNTKWLVTMTPEIISQIDQEGATVLQTSRLNPASIKATDVPNHLREETWQITPHTRHDVTPHILNNLNHLGLDCLIPIGGDDMLHYAERLARQGVPLIAIPKTMDNDVFGTDYCIGFSTAVTRSVNFINHLRLTTRSHERLGIIELFGKNSSETALIASYLADVDRSVISEVPFDPEKLATLLLDDKRKNISNYALMTISEGASMLGRRSQPYRAEANSFAHNIGAVTADILKKITGENIIFQQVAYLMRGGTPDAIDLMVGRNFANLTFDLVSQQQFGQMVALQNGKYTNVPINRLVEGVKRVDIDDLYDVSAYRPKVRQVNQKSMFLY